jgi:hypothetical protein
VHGTTQREIYLPETAIRTYLGARYLLRIRLTDGRVEEG